MNKLFQSGFLAAIVIVIFFPHKSVGSTESSRNDYDDSQASTSIICRRSGDRNKGHGNDPYIEFAINIEEIGKANISGDFDLDNPGASMDKQMKIFSEGETIQWASLNESQKQQIKDEWARQICLSSLFAD